MRLGEIPCPLNLLSSLADIGNNNDDAISLREIPRLFYLLWSSGGNPGDNNDDRTRLREIPYLFFSSSADAWNNNDDTMSLGEIPGLFCLLRGVPVQTLGIITTMQIAWERNHIFSTPLRVPHTLGIKTMMQWAYERFHVFSTSFGSSGADAWNNNDDAMSLPEIPCLFYLLSTSADAWNKNDDAKSLRAIPCLFYLPSSSGGDSGEQ